jgi:uncharacterized protein (DUF2164 family)/uncharacterized protein YjgD (DUF1641 family)
LENKQYDKLQIVDNLAIKLGLTNISNETKLALITRIVNLRDDSMVQVLKKENFNDEQIIKLQEVAYQFVSKYWIDIHNQTVEFIEKNDLLSPFYQAIFRGVLEVGIMMSKWQSSWTAHIINNINKTLLEQFDGDNTKVMKFLKDEKLFDLGHGGITADRCYSALKIDNKNNLKSSPYVEVFKSEVNEVIHTLEIFIDKLMNLEDYIYNQKWEHIRYFQSLIVALSERRCEKLVHYWAEVDRAWMKLTTPIQIGHLLEYYEDHFRKAVAIEWDIRLSNPKALANNKRDIIVKNMASKIFYSLDTVSKHKDIFNFANKSMEKVQLYLGRPALFFASQFNGLFSAQVVPNDEIVSKEEGKKIFAFSDEILQGQRAKPFLKLSNEFFGSEFLTKDRNFIFKEKQKWNCVYDITTIGHEFGHILWCDENTETVMNKNGDFKNIEEFKATSGGLVAFFLNDDEKQLEEYVICDCIKRAIGLIGWMEVDEVQPYYCEGMIHLSGMFKSGVLSWENQKLSIIQTNDTINNLKKWYIDTYKKLAMHYLNKLDASIFLENYTTKQGKYYLPVDDNIKDFVKYYFNRYKDIGQELDTLDKKENYLS